MFMICLNTIIIIVFLQVTSWTQIVLISTCFVFFKAVKWQSSLVPINELIANEFVEAIYEKNILHSLHYH